MLSEKEFIRAIEENRNIIFKVCNLYLDSQADRKDLFQEILMNAWKGIKNFRGQAKFSTWLYRVALNTSITYYKKYQKNVSAQMPGIEMVSGNEDPTVSDDRITAMNKAINELSAIDKALVMLYLEDYSHQEIADIMGITANLVGVKMNRIKVKLKENSKKYL